MSKVYKLLGESYEICEEPIVYSTYGKALLAAKEWEGFLGMSLQDAINSEEIIIVEWSLE